MIAPQHPESASEDLGFSASHPSWLGSGQSILVARVGDAALRFLLFLATARVLDAPDFSLYALLTAALATCQWTLSLGAPRVALYFHRRPSPGSLFGWLYLLATLAAAAVLLGVFGLPGLRRTVFSEVPTGWLLLGLAPLPFSLLADSLSATLLSSGRTRVYGVTLWMRSLGTGLVLLSSLASSQRLLWILTGRLAVQAGVAGTVALAARAKPCWTAVPSFVPEALRYGVPTALSDAVLALHRRADVFLLSAFGYATEIGGYALAYAISEAFWLVTDSLEAAFFVDIARQDEEAARRGVTHAFWLFFLLGLAGLVLGLVAGEGLLLVFFSSRYPGAATLLPWLLAAAVAWGVSRPFFSFLSSRGRPKTVLACHLSGLLINLALNILWIPRRGAAGAAAACLASYAAGSIAFFVAFRTGREAGNGRR